MKDRIRQILIKHSNNKKANDRIEADLLDLFSASGSLLNDERWRIWKELCKGETDGAFASTLQLEADDIHHFIFKGE